MRAQLRQVAVVLAHGSILFFASERVFWSFWRLGDDLGGMVVTWLVYSLLAYVFLILVRRFRVASFAPLFLCGAAFGWLAEGVVVNTLYGDPTNPFPLSVSWTGLAWHALLGVGVAWHLIGRTLAEPRPTRTVWLSLAFGVGWGLWAVWWPAELGAGADAPVLAFAGHAAACSAPYLLSWWVLGMARPDWFRPGRVAPAVLSALVLLVFLGVQVPTRPEAALILPPLLLACLAGLRRNAAEEKNPDLLDGLLGEVRPRNVIALSLIPAAAVAVYAPFRLLGWHPPTNIALYVATMPLGFWLLGRSLWVTIRRGASSPVPIEHPSPS
ncbi:hypothetical protein [Tautonia plasticadhaerens]|uniref:Uncharacterized protein n=1 Tax=Tautonia plasticadhaerens TaxID=2527974 RepID=A0A518H6D0_9BACT|nr:hypothetical protein [Tautonia plasticadhaerens]QDV36394.1 hypothetical protein ElP_43180 [Tautonia plasticadhaerens]